MDLSEARYHALQAESFAAALGRALQRLTAALEDAPASPREGARMALADAGRLVERTRFVRRLVEQLGPDLTSDSIPGGIREG